MEEFKELLDIVNSEEYSEVGGGHGQKGVDYQRHWAISHMFKLADEGQEDFLILFEAIQDVAVYDSSEYPKKIKIYQIKKKDRNEWGWKELTGLYVPKNNITKQPYSNLEQSTIGKLYSSVKLIKTIEATGYFISNAGCNLSLGKGGNAATTYTCTLSDLEEKHRDTLIAGLSLIDSSGGLPEDLSKIHICKTDLPVNDPKTFLVGEVHQYLKKCSPKHANQAISLVDSLLAKIGPLGAKTDKCLNTEHLIRRQGFSKKQFDSVLSDLQTVPDLMDYLDQWLQQLQSEGVSIFEITGIKVAASELFRNQLLKVQTPEILDLEKACDNELKRSNLDVTKLKPLFEDIHAQLKDKFKNVREPIIYAVIALRAIKSCVDQI